MADFKAAKLAAARKKLKDHQEKKISKSGDVFNSDNVIKPQIAENIYPYSTSQTQETSQLFEADQVLRSDIDLNTIINMKSDKLVPTINDHFANTPELNQQTQNNNITVTEILISEKRNLEVKIHSLENSLQSLKCLHTQTVSDLNAAKSRAATYDSELRDSKEHIKYLLDELEYKNKEIETFKTKTNEWTETKIELEEKLDSANTALTACSTQNLSLASQLTQCQRELEMTQLQLQLLTNGENIKKDITVENNESLEEQNKILQVRISKLKHQIETMLNEKEQIATHYKHYTDELRKQIESAIASNRQKEAENEQLNCREASLVDQISQMEIRIQALQNHIAVLDKQDLQDISQKSHQTKNELSIELDSIKDKKKIIEMELETTRHQLSQSELKITELTDTIERLQHEQPDVLKLTAANESDKVAAQRATVQNNKLKEELHGLQQAFITMSNDKLELTEKIQAEKFLNRQLTIKFSEAEETLKEVQSKLKAKDEEMIRLQENCCKLEKQILLDSQEMDHLRHYEVTKSTEISLMQQLDQAKQEINKLKHQNTLSEGNTNFPENVINNDALISDENTILTDPNTVNEKACTDDKRNVLPNEEAMLKLQQRFLRTMKDVAELSEEKQNLEHIVLQLQGETETICEYIALYQQQRGVLKQREEERLQQMKYLAAERERMQARLEELQSMITATIPEGAETNSKFQHDNVEKIVDLLTEIKQSHLIDPHTQCSGLQTFHPCPWCSGKLIDV